MTNATITPGVTWDGSAGTGYSSTPSDPARTGPKPALQWGVIPYQVLTERTTIFVGAIFNRVIADIVKIRFYCEGNTVDVTSPTSVGDIHNVWAVDLDVDAITPHSPGSDQVKMYAEAYTSNGQLNRVIGPIFFYVDPSGAVDGSSSDPNYYIDRLAAGGGTGTQVAPFQTIEQAINAHKNHGSDGGNCIILRAGTYTLSTSVYGYNGALRWIKIKPHSSIIGTVTPGGAVNSGVIIQGAGPLTNVNFTTDFLWWESVIFDRSTFWIISSATNQRQAFVNCEVYDPNGAQSLYGHKTRANAGSPVFYGYQRYFYVDGAYVHDTNGETFSNLKLLKNSVAEKICGDIQNACYARFNNQGKGITCLLQATPVNAFKVRYTGAASVAQIAHVTSGASLPFSTGASGNSDSNSRIVLVEDGVTKMDVTCGTNTIAQIIATINTKTGWTATSDNSSFGANTTTDDVYAYALTRATAAGQGAPGWVATTVTGSDLQIRAAFDVHGDWDQTYNPSGDVENIVSIDETFDGTNNDGGYQVVFFADTSGSYKDVGYLNMTIKNATLGAVISMGCAQDHVVLDSCSLLTHSMLLRTDQSVPDKYVPTNCAFIDSVFKTVPAAVTGLTLQNNHYIDDASAHGDTSGTYGPAYLNADCTPQINSPLQGRKKGTPVWTTDVNGTALRSTGAAIGAYQAYYTAPRSPAKF